MLPHMRLPLTVYSTQAEVFWLREQLDHERSRANTAPSETRRLALETAQKQREVLGLQGQVASLRQHLLEAAAALHAQQADLAVCQRAQLQDDWTRYASTRKRLLTSMVRACLHHAGCTYSPLLCICCSVSSALSSKWHFTVEGMQFTLVLNNNQSINLRSADID